jgi:hypothetical protein
VIALSFPGAESTGSGWEIIEKDVNVARQSSFLILAQYPRVQQNSYKNPCYRKGS